MTENVLNNTTNAKFIPTIIAQKALGRLKSYLHVAARVSRDSDWTTATAGTTVNVPKRGAVSANDKTAGDAYTKQNPTATDVSVVLNKHKEVTFTIDDVTKVVENQDTQAGYAEDGAIAIAEAIETDLLDLHPSITNTVTWDSTSATTIDTSLLNVRKFFTDQKVPKTEQKYLVIDATVFNDMLATDKYTRYDALGNASPITSGTLLRVYGFEISESQLIPTSGSPVAYHNIAFTRNGLVLATRPLPAPEGFGGRYARINDPDVGVAMRSLFWYNADIGAHQLTLDVLYGVAILDVRRVVEVESS